MSVKQITKAWSVEGLSHTQKLVLLALADNSNDDGYCWPSMSVIARKCCLSEYGATRIVKQLEGIGLIRVQRGGGRSRASRYWMTINPQQETPNIVGCNDKPPTGNTQYGSVKTQRQTQKDPTPLGGIEPSYNRQEPSGTSVPKSPRPTQEQVKLLFSKAGLPEREAEKFFDHYTANGWRVGKNPMRSLEATVRNWKRNWEERRYGNQPKNTPVNPVTGSSPVNGF